MGQANRSTPDRRPAAGGEVSPRVPRGAVAATVVALVALNLAVAYPLARLLGLRTLAWPDAVGWALLALGLLAGLAAVAGWRRYLALARLRSRGDARASTDRGVPSEPPPERP